MVSRRRGGGRRFQDDVLRLVFTYCHPALPEEAQIALTLRTICGLTTAEIAKAFLVSEKTMAQRLVRAKGKMRDAGLPYQVPSLELIADRVDGVLAVIYLIFSDTSLSGVTGSVRYC